MRRGAPLPAQFHRLTTHDSQKNKGRVLESEVTREVEGDPSQGGAQWQRRGSDTMTQSIVLYTNMAMSQPLFICEIITGNIKEILFIICSTSSQSHCGTEIKLSRIYCTCTWCKFSAMQTIQM